MNKVINLISIIIFLCFFSCQSDKQEDPSGQEQEKVSETQSTAVELADAQLTAYNKRDLEAFLIPYSDSVNVFSDLHQFGYQGKDKMRGFYQSWFNSLDTLNCELVNRISTGNTVIDHEHITFQRKGQEITQFEAIAIYKTEGDKIQEVHFVKPKWEN